MENVYIYIVMYDDRLLFRHNFMTIIIFITKIQVV